MNSGELDLKMRRKVSVAPPDAGADRVAAWALGAAKPHTATTPAEVQANEATQVSRIERARDVLILFIRCAMQTGGLRSAQELLPAAKRVASSAVWLTTSRREGHNAAAPAPPANGRAPPPGRRPRRPAPASPSWRAAREPSTAFAACQRDR